MNRAIDIFIIGKFVASASKFVLRATDDIFENRVWPAGLIFSVARYH